MSKNNNSLSNMKSPTESSPYLPVMCSIYEIIHICTAVVDESKENDHRSKLSNLSCWKEEAWKNQGFNGIRTGDLRDTGVILNWAMKPHIASEVNKLSSYILIFM